MVTYAPGRDPRSGGHAAPAPMQPFRAHDAGGRLLAPALAPGGWPPAGCPSPRGMGHSAMAGKVILQQADGHPTVRLYRDPFAGSPLLGEVPCGKEVRVLDQHNDYLFVRSNICQGWVGRKNATPVPALSPVDAAPDSAAISPCPKPASKPHFGVTPPSFSSFDGAARLHTGRGGGYCWILHANDPDSRWSRQEAAKVTTAVCEAGGYMLDGRFVGLPRARDLPARTSFVMATRAQQLGPGSLPYPPTLSMHDPGRIYDVARERTVAGGSVAVINASSAYHVGGAFTTGGRHALEESLCMQSALFSSLAAAADQARGYRVPPPPWCEPAHKPDGGGPWQCHIPFEGAVLSPGVEFFRAGSLSGYPFLEEPVCFAAVVSVAMPNCNSSVRDAPRDVPPIDAVYHRLLEAKFTAALAAAVLAGANVLVVPDAGCGVYGNKASDVGQALGSSLRRMPLHFREVHLVGSADFALAVTAACRFRTA